MNLLKTIYKVLFNYKAISKNMKKQTNILDSSILEKEYSISEFITYAKYKVIRNKYNKVVDMQFIFANDRLKNILSADPTSLYRSQILPNNEKICSYALNVIDICIAKHFSYQSSMKGFETIEAIMEADIYQKDVIYIYTVDVNLLNKDNNEQILRNNVSTILSMFNITLLHWNAKDHYIYNDTILTTDFSKDNPLLFVGNNIRSSYSLFKITRPEQQEQIQKMVNEFVSNNESFLSFNVKCFNSVKEEILVKVNIIKEQGDNMYMIGILY